MRWLAILILVLIWPLPGAAQEMPAPLSDTVSDYTGLLDPETEARISDTLRAARAETGVHVALAVIDRRADYGDAGRLDAFATRLFNAWGIGDPVENDGILILVATGDREMRIALGSAYPVVYDGRAQRVIDTAMLPAFRDGRMAEGIEAGVTATIEFLVRPFKEGRQVTETDGFPEEGNLPLYLFLAFLGGIVALRFRDRLGAAMLRMRRCPNCGRRALTRHVQVLSEPGETTAGQGVEHITCGNCGGDRTRPVTLPRRATRKKSSSGGFGGGRSSGGGASGRW